MEKVDMKRFQNVLLWAAIAAFAVIVLGGIVRATGAANACGGWPLCRGSWQLPQDPAAQVDFFHRLATIGLAPLLGWAVVLARKQFRNDRMVSGAVFSALGLYVAQVALGAVVAFLDVPARQPWTAVHLVLSLALLALLVAALVVVMYRRFSTQSTSHLKFETPFARLSLLTLGAMLVLLLTGAVVAATGAEQACTSWPLCGGNLIPQTPAAWIQMIHRLAVAGTSLLVAVHFVQAWRTQRSQTAVFGAATAATTLFIAQALMGGVRVWEGFPMYMLALHQATAVAVWAALAVEVVAVGMAGRTAQEEQLEAAEFGIREGGWGSVARGLFALTKPVVVALLLVTTYAGMVIGAQAWPGFGLTFWTLLGGAMASGGSGAINQFIDRKDDGKMQRTLKRPIPSGRLTPAEGLAFGILLTLASFYLMLVFVNLLAALLTLAGIIYYVLIYSIWLKKTTTQNIVIGGGAGAIPPLVGWAAATGSLNFASMFLFAVVFLWTPPHFWALAIVRAKDYARAGVPMLPVVRGEAETRKQILIYTIELVALTLFLPVIGLGGAVYLVSAVVLGVLLLYSAWNVWRVEGNKVAWKMYRHSSMYLAFLFLALMVDRLL